MQLKIPGCRKPATILNYLLHKMIEQTDLVVNEWIYLPPSTSDSDENISASLTFQVQKKNATSKKGLACRFSCLFVKGNETILSYIGQDSYVIDLEDRIDANEVWKMIKNSYTKYKEKYEFKRLGTVLQNTPLAPFDETMYDIGEIISFLN